MRVRSLGQEAPLGKEAATPSSILVWRIPWTEEPVGYSPWGRQESDMAEHAHTLPGSSEILTNLNGSQPGSPDFYKLHCL